MRSASPIPAFSLYGEETPFPDIIHCEAVSARAPRHDWQIETHLHRQLAQLFVIRQGVVEAQTDGTKHRLTEESFLFVPALCVHEFRFAPQTDGMVVSFPTTLLAGIGPEGRGVQAALARPFAGALAGSVAALVDTLYGVYLGRSMFRPQQATALSHSILTLIAEGQETAPAAPPRLTALNDLIAAHRDKGWSASDYARALSVSTGHLSRLCRSATGLGAAAYIEHRVMQEACRLLAFTRLPVSEVAFRLGFADPSYFSKRFAKACGATPSAYRARFVTA